MEHFPLTFSIALSLAPCASPTNASAFHFLCIWLFLLSLLICVSSLFPFHWLLFILLDNLCYITGTYLHASFMGVCACESDFKRWGACSTVSFATLLGAYVWLCFICGNFFWDSDWRYISLKRVCFCQTWISWEESKNKLITSELFTWPWRPCEDQLEVMEFLFPALSGIKVETDSVFSTPGCFCFVLSTHVSPGFVWTFKIRQFWLCLPFTKQVLGCQVKLQAQRKPGITITFLCSSVSLSSL